MIRGLEQTIIYHLSIIRISSSPCFANGFPSFFFIISSSLLFLFYNYYFRFSIDNVHFVVLLWQKKKKKSRTPIGPTLYTNSPFGIHSSQIILAPSVNLLPPLRHKNEAHKLPKSLKNNLNHNVLPGSAGDTACDVSKAMCIGLEQTIIYYLLTIRIPSSSCGTNGPSLHSKITLPGSKDSSLCHTFLGISTP